MYFIAILLPADLNEIIQQYKLELFEKFGCRVGLKSPAHITLQAPFWLDENKEAELVQVLSKFETFPAFYMETNDYSCFAPRTIFIDVKPSRQLEEVKRLADQYFPGNPAFGIQAETRPFRPHITLATRDLRKKDFAEAWQQFSSMTFRKGWWADNISLLKHQQKNWDVAATSQFDMIQKGPNQNL